MSFAWRFAVDGEKSEQSELLYPRYLLTLLATWPIAYSRVSSCCIVSYWGRQMRCQYRNYDRKREVTFCTHTEWEDGQNRPKCRHVAKITIFLQDTDSTGNKNPAKLGPDIVPFCVVFICIIYTAVKQQNNTTEKIEKVLSVGNTLTSNYGDILPYKSIYRFMLF